MFPETKRQRYLTREEFARLGQVLNELEQDGTENVFVLAAIRLFFFTGARVGEILTLQWAYVDVERGFLLLPDSKTGQKQIRLGKAAVEVLAGVPRIQGNPHVIVGRFDRASRTFGFTICDIPSPVSLPLRVAPYR
jgi:integrase